MTPTDSSEPEARPIVDLEPLAAFEEALRLARHPDRCQDCVALYEVSARAGVPDALVNLGAIREAGSFGVPIDHGRAAQLYEAAATQGHAIGQYNLARLYHSGKGVQRDPARAFHLYEQASEGGSVDAMVNFASMLSRGEGCTQDLNSAVAWYARAAEKGHPLGMRALALAHLTGEGGVAIDAGASRAWLKKAAEGGDGYSWFELGRLLWHGLGGPRERREGLRLALRAGRTEDGWHETATRFGPLVARFLAGRDGVAHHHHTQQEDRVCCGK